MAAMRSEKREKAFQLYMDGYELKEIAEIQEVSYGQIRQWKMLDKWDQLKETSVNGKELMLILLSGTREGNKKSQEALGAVCKALINNGYLKHGEDPESLYRWILSYIFEVEKVEVWNWIKYELWEGNYMDNRGIEDIFNNTNNNSSQ